MIEPKKDRQTPTQSVALPYFAIKGQEAVELYNKSDRATQEWQQFRSGGTLQSRERKRGRQMPYNYNNYNRPKKLNRNNRPDHQRGHRMEFERNRKKVLAKEEICAICGQKVDKRLKYPHPMSATVDHIIPVSKGGHPSDIENLQLAHFYCNRQKSDKLIYNAPEQEGQAIDNRDLPLSINWALYEEDSQSQLNRLREEVERIEATGRHLYADGIR